MPVIAGIVYEIRWDTERPKVSLGLKKLKYWNITDVSFFSVLQLAFIHLFTYPLTHSTHSSNIYWVSIWPRWCRHNDWFTFKEPSLPKKLNMYQNIIKYVLYYSNCIVIHRFHKNYLIIFFLYIMYTFYHYITILNLV